MIIKRLYSSQEVVEGLHLVWDVFIRENANSCTQQGIEEFARFIKMENFMPLVESGEMIVFGAVEGQDLGGVGAVRRDGHISLLFVRPDLRRKGIAKALVGEMCRYCTMQFALMRMTVNASVVSTEAYHHMGFRDLAPVQEKNGIRFVPMDLMISPANVRSSYNGKKHTGLFIGIAVTVLIFLIFLGLLFGKIISNFASGEGNRRIRHRFLNITRMRTEKLTISLAVMEMKRIIRKAVLKKHRESRQLKATRQKICRIRSRRKITLIFPMEIKANIRCSLMSNIRRSQVWKVKILTRSMKC